MRVSAPAKVNLCLFLGPPRGDGRHELVTVFQSLTLCDELLVRTLSADAGGDRVLCAEVPDEAENLAARALAGLRARGWAGPPLELEIRKRIPIAGGMAGGSADAAAALRAAMALDPGRPEELEALAASLGADVPSQLVPGPAIGTGAGDLVERLGPFAPHAFLVVPGSEPLASPAVFREADRLGLPRTRGELSERLMLLQEALSGPEPRVPDELLVNDLEPAAVSLQPEIGRTLEEVREAGADRAMVSGSGPTVFGLWWGGLAGEQATAAATDLAARHPLACAALPADSSAGTPELV